MVWFHFEMVQKSFSSLFSSVSFVHELQSCLHSMRVSDFYWLTKHHETFSARVYHISMTTILPKNRLQDSSKQKRFPLNKLKVSVRLLFHFFFCSFSQSFVNVCTYAHNWLMWKKFPAKCINIMKANIAFCKWLWFQIQICGVFSCYSVRQQASAKPVQCF